MSEQQRRSRSGFVGRLTSLYRSADGLLNEGDADEVSRKIEEVEDAFLRFSRSHYEYFNSLVDAHDKEVANRYYNDQLQRKLLFVQKMKTWLRENTQINPNDSVSNAGSLATSSVALKRIKANRAVAELEMHQLKRRQELIRQEEEMKMQRQLLEAQYKLEKAQLEVQIYSEQIDDADNGELDDYITVDEYVDLPREFHEQSKTNIAYDELYGVLPYVNDDNQYDVKSENVANDNDYVKKSKRPAPPKTKVKKEENMMMNLAHMIHLPRPDLAVYDGNPLEYHNFIQCFQNYIEKNALNESERLMYLLQYTTGDAKRIIKSCAMMDQSKGYKTARELLKERFGHPFTIATSCVSQLTDGPTLKDGDRSGLLLFADELKNCQHILESIGYLEEINSADNLRRIVSRLPYQLRRRFIDLADDLQQRGERVTIFHISKFVNKKARAVNDPVFGVLIDPHNKGTYRDERPVPKPRERFPPKSSERFTPKSSERPSPKPRTMFATQQSFTTSVVQAAKSDCPACKEQHSIKSCAKFSKMSYDDRVKIMRSSNLCNNCFKPGHIALGCLVSQSCDVDGCKKRHHPLLHPPNRDNYTSPTSHGKSDANAAQVNSVNTPSTSDEKICLRIIPVQVQGPYKSVITYALLDNGSDVSLCDKELASEIGVEGEERMFLLTTQEKKDSEKIGQHIKNLDVQSVDGVNTLKINNLWTVDNLHVSSQSIPTNTEVQRWPHLHDVSLTDFQDKRVKLIIGSNVPEAFWVLEERRGNVGEPYAIRSPLGWTILGPTKTSYEVNSHTSSFVRLQEDEKKKEKDDLLIQVQRFWEMDHVVSTSDRVMSLEDKQAIQTMEGSVKLKDGHYEVGLPWKQEIPYLPNNRSLAEQRLKMLKKRFLADNELFLKYRDTMQDYMTKGHATRVPEEEVKVECKPLWYLPHHPVFNLNKPGKTRVVFDCSAKFRGSSLNEQLLSGPDLTNSIVGVLTRFRQEEVALAADIECMFHQVKVPPADYDAFRFLWWPDNDLTKDPVDHRMEVHLFGATSSPSCSSFALKRTAEDNKNVFSEEAVSTINNNFYVDDCLKSVKSCDQAIDLAKELTVMLSKGGFRLTKWLSNKPEVLESIPEGERSAKVLDLDLDKERLPVERTLGLKWDMHNDTFTFDVKPKDKPATRRGILSLTSSVYDPLGFLAPVILPAKKITQDLCRKQLDWDDPIDETDLQSWNAWKDQIPQLSQLSIKRCLKSNSSNKIKRAELHNFADASQHAYGAVSYLRLLDETDSVHVSFLMGKSRLAHIRPATIPRLELSAAVIATEMDKVLRKELDITIDESVFWTDSTSVLQYIRNTSTRFHTYVANRLTVIHENSKPYQWRYVPTELNPADDASRGITVQELCHSSNWLYGPRFLLEEKVLWPAEPLALLSNQDLENDPKVKSTPLQCSSTHVSNDQDALSRLTKRYSSWNKLKRAVAWLMKFKKWLGNHKICHSRQLSVEELQQAETTIIKHIQRQTYPEVIRAVKDTRPDVQQRQVKAKLKKLPSSLYGLSPIIDEQGILRVGGRLENSSLPYEAKHQIILPRRHPVTDLIIQAHHKDCGHLGEAYVLSSLRQNYWIIKGKSAVRSVIGKCFLCKRMNSLPMKQMMGELPRERVRPDDPPFTSVGVDFFGPIYVRQRRSHVKRYGCVFTCLATRAVHIEITESLDTDAFINALRRFSNTRGNPATVYSDNGTNLRAGEREIYKSIQEWNQEQINKTLSQKEIKWNFNPPSASHMGGVWERVIRSIRKITRAMLGNQVVTDEILRTTMSEVQGILNSRPLTPLSNDVNDMEVLTPNHLLLLRSNMNLPLGLYNFEDGYCRRRWKQVQYFANVFWRRWLKEFLPTLQLRQKWFGPKRNLRVGDLVLISDENTPRGKWPLGRITEVNFGRDGLVRSAKLLTRGSLLCRPVTKLCFLEHQID